MIDQKAFLPQYAAHAIIDLEDMARRHHTRLPKQYVTALRATIELLRTAVHVVLPPNGEVYRTNNCGGAMPSADECLSLEGLPAPVTCFEFPWEYATGVPPTIIAPRRIVLVVDGKQTNPDQPEEGLIHVTTWISIVFDVQLRTWVLMDLGWTAPTPLKCEPKRTKDGGWGVRIGAINFTTGARFSDSGMDEPPAKFLGEFLPDLGAVIQCCHALRAGATFREEMEPSSSRRRKMAKRGVGGFTYHVLSLPKHATNSEEQPSGTHAGPRLHVRRAHIRKLPTGLLTFVRQCLVGTETRGVVEKSYRVSQSIRAQ